jgi:DNA-directed RNA polymerase subunit RPC12/RpoP
MSILVTCSCGAKFKAKVELAGKRLKCPTCGHPLSVPTQEAATTPIRVACQCGQAFQAKVSLAGKAVACPACSPAIPGEMAVSGACGGVPLLGLEDAQFGRKGRCSFGVWCSRVGKDSVFSCSMRLPSHLSSTSAQTLITKRGSRPRELHKVVTKRL